jgi:hypothetical protein
MAQFELSEAEVESIILQYACADNTCGTAVHEYAIIDKLLKPYPKLREHWSFQSLLLADPLER